MPAPSSEARPQPRRAGRGWAHTYEPSPPADDEAFAPDGRPRPAYEPVLEALERHDPRALEAEVTGRLQAGGVTFGDGIFSLDPVPRLLAAAEWRRLEAGLLQRARALDAFVADVYGERAAFAAGALPARLLEDTPLHEPLMRDVEPPRGRWVHGCGFDVVRGGDGELIVLEDNTRTPSGLAYALAARSVCGELLDGAGLRPRPVEPALAVLGECLRAAAPADAHEPLIAVLTDGPSSSAFYEHSVLARELGFPLVTLADLETSGGRLWLRRDGRRSAVDVVYRRTDDSRLSDAEGRLTPVGEALLEPLRAGTLGVANAFGAGIADDKLTYAYVPRMIRFYLREEPLIASVPSYDLADEAQREAARERVDELVVKPRAGLGGEGVVVGAVAGEETLDDLRQEIARRPHELIAQERVSLSTHPCLADGRLEPRRIDLRPFAFAAAEGHRVAPAALTRFAAGRRSMIVNSSQGGGAKDTWVVG